MFDKFIIEKYFDADEDESATGTLVLFSSLFAILISGISLIFGFREIIFDPTIASAGVLVGILSAFWLYLYLHAIERTELSRTIPVFQTIPIFGFMLAYFFLGETLTMQQIGAGFLIIFGSFILSYHFTSKRFDYVSLGFMLGASAMVALTEILFKISTLESSYWNSAFWLGIGFFLSGVALYASVPRYRREFKKFAFARSKSIWFVTGINEMLDTTANLTFIFAITLGPVALVQSMNAYQPLIILFAATVATKYSSYFNEDFAGVSLYQKIAAILLMSLGSIWLYYSVLI